MLLDLVQKARQSGTSLQYKGLLCQSIESIHQLWSLLLDLVQNKGHTELNPLSVQRCTKYNAHNTTACAILSKYNCVRESLNVNSSNSLPELRLVDVISWTGQVHQVHPTVHQVQQEHQVHQVHPA